MPRCDDYLKRRYRGRQRIYAVFTLDEHLRSKEIVAAIKELVDATEFEPHANHVQTYYWTYLDALIKKR